MITLKIDSVSQSKVQFGMKTTFACGDKKYSFFDTKKDKTLTKAFEQFRKHKFGVGDTIEAEVKEEEKSFTNEAGKVVNYTQRTILYFGIVENVPTAPMAQPVKRNAWKELDDLQKRVKALEKNQAGMEESEAMGEGNEEPENFDWIDEEPSNPQQ